MQRSALCRSRRELSNAYLLAKIGVDTAENEPLEVWGEISIHYSLHSLVMLAPQLVMAELAALRLHDEFNLGSFQIATIPRSRHGSVMVPYILT